MRRRTHGNLGLVCALGVVLTAGSATAQLCSPTANPCVVASNVNVASGTVINLGTRDLVIASNRTLNVQGAGVLSVMARNIFLDDGARIMANGGGAGVGGDVTLTASGFITLDPVSRIDVSSGSGGAIQLNAGAVGMNGQLRANATLRDGEGGFVSIHSTGIVNIGGTGILGSSGDRFGCGGFMEIVADASVTVNAPLEFKGGDCDGGDVDIDALNNITVNGAVSLIATYEFGSGGSASFTAGGNVTLGGSITATGSGTLLEGGGDGGDVDVIGDTVSINAPITLTGAGPDGSGGFVDLSALTLLRLNAPVIVVGAQEGVGGDVLLASDGAMQVNSTIDMRAGFSGGSLDAFAVGTFSGVAATVIDASGTGSPFGRHGGTVDIVSCNLTLPSGADIFLTGSGPAPRATARLSASGTMTIAGSIVAGARVELHYRSIPPVFVPGFVVSPAAQVTADPALPCCVACGATTTSTSSSSSTSSTIGGPTTTLSSTTTSSSTSSTLPLGPCGVPLAGCRSPIQPFKAKLLVRDKSKDTADKIAWKWLRGEATAASDFGNPLTTHGYRLCMWSIAGSPSLMRIDAPAGGVCKGRACWRTAGRGVPKGFKYADAELTPNGAQKVVLLAGGPGQAKVTVKAKGESLALPPLPLPLPVRVQLHGAGKCWETFFTATGVVRNTADVFEGRASFPLTTTSTSTSTTSTTSPVPVCGNGALEGPEQCDDGNLVDRDCCSSTCHAEPPFLPCPDDGNVCTSDFCSGFGFCGHLAGNAGVTCRPPVDACDAAEQCTGASIDCPADTALPDGMACQSSPCRTDETCTDGVCGGGSTVVCGDCERCDATAGCVAAPVEVCRQTIEGGRSTLLIKDLNPNEGDKIIWKWTRGEETTLADVGTPTEDDGYVLCLYDESTPSTALVTRLRAPAAGACASNACWRSSSSGYKYVDPELTPDGIRKMLIRVGGNGRALVSFKAKGPNTPTPLLPLQSQLRVQLQGNGECWEATYSAGGTSENDYLEFRARSD
jgi:cysteine-rich repeat protein